MSTRRLAFVGSLSLAVFASSLRAAAQCPSWQSLGAGNDVTPAFTNAPSIYVHCAAASGAPATAGLYIGGDFNDAGSAGAARLARWNAGSWSALGAAPNGMVVALCAADDGAGPAIFAAGQFSQIGGIGANGVARWNGSSWQSLGMAGGIWGSALAAGDIGGGASVYIGTGNAVWRWDGAQLTPVSTLLSWTVQKLHVADLGAGPSLYAIRYYTGFGTNIYYAVARWTGTAWTDLCNSFAFGQRIDALATYHSSSGPQLCIGGWFSNLNGFAATNLATWNGSALGTLGTGPANEVCALAEFDAGTGAGPELFTGERRISGANAASRWDGAAWSSLASHVGAAGNVPAIYELVAFDEHSGGPPVLCAAGGFGGLGSVAANDVAFWRACPVTGVSTCFGDGTALACPCGNNGAAGRGCENSASTGGARLDAAGLASLTQDTLGLSSSGELPSVLSIFLQGTQAIAPVNFGDGLRCAGGTLRRLYTHAASSGVATAPVAGDASISARSSALGDALSAGSTRWYQVYYRDPSTGFCAAPAGNTWNVSNGVRIGWLP